MPTRRRSTTPPGTKNVSNMPTQLRRKWPGDQRSVVGAGSRTAASVIMIVVALLLLCFLQHTTPTPSTTSVLKHNESACTDGCWWPVGCDFTHYTPRVPGCHPSTCGVHADHGFLDRPSVERLIKIIDKGMVGCGNEARLDADGGGGGGPCILDVNSGFVVASGGAIRKIYEPVDGKGSEPLAKYTREEYEFYEDVIERIRIKIHEVFEVDAVKFTFPSFMTRFHGGGTWAPSSPHDEYWHIHVDKETHSHVDYAGLLYLSEHGVDFEGGTLNFQATVNSKEKLIVEPTPGLLLTFTSGRENPHRALKVTSGTRYTLSFWFTCDQNREFSTYLDGKMHMHFGEEEGRSVLRVRDV